MDDKRLNQTLYDKISNKIITDLEISSDDIRLTEIKHLDEFTDDIQQTLRALYDSPISKVRRFASILNSIYSQAENVFVITYRLYSDLIKEDSNHIITTKPGDGVSYRQMLSFALGNGYITELRKPSRISKGIYGKAGLYELTDKDFITPLIDMIGYANCKAKKDARLKWYDENNTEQNQKEDEIETTPEILEERKRIRERLNERKNK